VKAGEPTSEINPGAMMGIMLDTRLVGYWSDKHLYLGGMAAADIAFCADGTGWTNWSNVAGAFEVLRFRWRQTSGSSLTLRLREYVSGTWSLDGDTTTHQPGEHSARDEQIVLGYEITAGHTVIGDPVEVLEFDRHIIRGVLGNRFAFERELTAHEHGPAYNSEMPPGI
jgi:hypothetical protein